MRSPTPTPRPFELKPHSAGATAAGFAALVTWSSSVAFARLLAEDLRPLMSATLIYLFSGGLSCAWAYRRREDRRKLLRLPPRYVLGCMLLFLTYTACYHVAIGFSINRRQVLEVGLINYLWPLMTLVLSIPILKTRAGPLLSVGLVLGFLGMIVATLPGGADWTNLREFWTGFAGRLSSNGWPYLVAFAAAVSWGLYSNLSKRWGQDAEGGAVPLFMLGTGLVLGTIRLFVDEPSQWRWFLVWPLAGDVVVATIIPCILWDVSMRRGSVTIVNTAAYFVLLMSSLLSCLMLQVLPSASFWAACALVVAGALICRASIRSEPGGSNRAESESSA